MFLWNEMGGRFAGEQRNVGGEKRPSRRIPYYSKLEVERSFDVRYSYLDRIHVKFVKNRQKRVKVLFI